MSGIRAIVSDFGGVLSVPLTEAFAAVAGAAAVTPEEFGAALGRIAREEGENPFFALERGELPAAEFLDRVERALAADLGRDVSLDGFAERLFANLPANEEMLGYMRSLRERGYRMAILTNNVREWQPLWRAALKLDEVFDLIVDSGFEGTRKPERRIYELTVERLGVAPRECLFVDDFEVNCEAARDLGMTAVWFRTTDQAVAEIEAALA